jgi:hypothetical protein
MKDETTRREWLLRLGDTACLFGFRGAPGEHSWAEGLERPESSDSPAQALPPGLYGPSNDQMTHALMSDERYRTIVHGCETDFVTPRTGPFEPRFFSSQEFTVVRRLLELMLGEVAAPSGSSDVAVGSPRQDVVAEIAEWIDLVVSGAAAVREAARSLSAQHRALAGSFYGPEVVRRLETAEPEKTWREGLNWLAAESQNRYSRAFLELSEAQAVELLTLVSDGHPERSTENAGTRLFQLLKDQTVHGFYTSQRGLKELDFKGNAFYADCPGCSGHHQT